MGFRGQQAVSSAPCPEEGSSPQLPLSFSRASETANGVGYGRSGHGSRIPVGAGSPAKPGTSSYLLHAGLHPSWL